MTLAPGVRLGPYEILSLLGQGGMGEVYRARDAKLQRDVALKVLPDFFALDADRLARFTREAHVLAALNHPHIAGIYGFEESDGVRALVLELVEGPTLADRIAQGPIPLDEALPIARQIAEALEAAHEQGIVHRDLKPANIKVRDDGTVKVLDFGLAKALSPDGASGTAADVSQSPTITSPAATRQGMILGTVAYMSPEQARGKAVDRRTDIWAFGCVLYEMLTGKRAFGGDDVTETIAAVVRDGPDWSALPANTPSAIRRLLRRALAKDRRERLSDATVARLEIDEALTGSAERAPGAISAPWHRQASFWRRAVPWVAGVLIGALVALGGTRLWTDPTTTPTTRFAIDHPGPEVLGSNFDADVVMSPDGTRLVYLTHAVTDPLQTQLHVRELGQLEAKMLSGLSSPRSPFLSPDGQWVGFVEHRTRTLRKVPIGGGPAVTICDLAGGPRGATWGVDGSIIFAINQLGSGLRRVSAAGGTVEVLTTPDRSKGEAAHWFPEMLPGGRGVLFSQVGLAADSVNDVSSENTRIAVLDLQSGQARILVTGGTHARYVSSGHLVYGVDTGLNAVAFDLNRLEVRGTPVPVLDTVVTKSTGAGSFSMSLTGTFAYTSGAQSGPPQRTLVWVDRTGREEPLGVPPRTYVQPRISPDGTRVALDIRDREPDIWIWDFRRRTLTRLTSDSGRNRDPLWSPDGRHVVFSALRDGSSSILRRVADGSGASERLIESTNDRYLSSFSADGKWLVFDQPQISAPDRDLGVIRVESEPRRAELLLNAAFNEENGAISPDGAWLAYQSNESGLDEIYVRPFPALQAGRWQISSGGGSRPIWARNGRELFYLAGTDRLRAMAAAVQPGTVFSIGNPQLLFEGPYFEGGGAIAYDVSPDGKRLLMIKDAVATESAAQPAEIVVTLNWFEELKRLVPAN